MKETYPRGTPDYHRFGTRYFKLSGVHLQRKGVVGVPSFRWWRKPECPERITNQLSPQNKEYGMNSAFGNSCMSPD